MIRTKQRREDRDRIISLLMESDEYKNYGFTKSKTRMLKECNAHNFAHMIPFGDEWEI